jgi:Bax protein
MKPFFPVLVIVSCLLISCGDGSKNVKLKTEYIKVDSLSQIIPVNDSLVRPIIYVNVSGFEKYPFHEVKSTFISLVLPSILIAKHKIKVRRERLYSLRERKIWNKEDSVLFANELKYYKAKNFEDLLPRLETLPTSIVLAQAAVETGWGHSRFFTEGNNLFGIWSVKKDESRMVANKTRKDQKIYLKAYPDLSLSVVDYFETLGRARAYRSLRSAIATTKDPFTLLPHLKYYSEQRLRYVTKLKKIISQNDFMKYDNYQIDPAYMIEE